MKWSIQVGVSGAALLLSAIPGYAEMFRGFPDAIICSSAEAKLVAYLHEVRKDGSAVYMALNRQFGTVSPDGVLQRKNAPDCDGKTLNELRASGQAKDFSK